jgi:(1->4)-alpha-D-glucan 1-alpha-D-glucosylmutase
LHPLRGSEFRKDLLSFHREVEYFGALNALAQVLLKGTAPGVPDFYQGTEVWNFSLVDPDNRRPVDFRARQRMLEELKHEQAEDRERLIQSLCAHWKDGRIKMYLTSTMLEFRRDHAALFARGSYLPLRVEGQRAGHLFACARRIETDTGVQWCVVAVPLQMVSVMKPQAALCVQDVWGDTRIVLPTDAPTGWQNIFTQTNYAAGATDDAQSRVLSANDLFAAFPVCLLAGESLDESSESARPTESHAKVTKEVPTA